MLFAKENWGDDMEDRIALNGREEGVVCLRGIGCRIVVATIHRRGKAKRFVQHGQGPIEAIEAVQQFRFGNDQRWGAMNVRVAVQSDQSVVLVGLSVLAKGIVGRFVLEFGDASVQVLNIKTPEQSDGSKLFDARMTIGEALHSRGKDGRQLVLDAMHNVVLQQMLDRLIRDRHGDGMGLVRRPIPQRLVFKVFHNGGRTRGHAEWDGRPRNAFGGGHNVGHHTGIMLKTKESTGPSKSHHDFVQVQQNAVLVANGSDALQVAWRKDEHTTRPNNALNHNAGNEVRTFVEDLFFEHVESGRNAFVVRCSDPTGLEEEWER